MLLHKNKLEELFRPTTEIHAVEIHHFQENNEISQEVDTSILEFYTISGCMLELVTDRTGLGRWCWINLKGNSGNIYRIVCDYQPCGKPSTSTEVLGTVYDKQIMHHRSILDTRPPIKLFRE